MSRDRRDDDYDDRPRRRDDDRDDRPRRRDDDDRPRRRDDDDRPRRRDEDDRPRRRVRDDAPPRKETSVLGVFGMIGSIIALLMSFIPIVGMFAWIPGGIALLKSVIALILAKVSQGRVGSGIPLTGTILSVVSILIAIIQVVLLVVIAKNMPTPTPPADLSSPAEVIISAEQLDKEYDDNEFSADTKYKGKVIDVTGIVERVSDDVKKFRLTVELTGIEDSTIDCDFRTSQKSELASLKVGSAVTIRGRCRGKRDEFVTLEECAIVPAETSLGNKTTETTAKTSNTGTRSTGPITRATGTKPTNTLSTGTKPTNTNATSPKPSDTKPTTVKPPADNVIKISAADLAKAFTTDADAANKKYKDKVLEVTGKIWRNKLYVQPEMPAICLGQMDTKLEIECRVSEKVKEELTFVNLGDVITFRGKCAGKDDEQVVLEGCKLVK